MLYNYILYTLLIQNLKGKILIILLDITSTVNLPIKKTQFKPINRSRPLCN